MRVFNNTVNVAPMREIREPKGLFIKRKKYICDKHNEVN